MSPKTAIVHLALLPLLGACSATPEPVAPPPTAETPPVVPDTPPAPKLPCPSKDACEEAGGAARQAGNEARAKELYGVGCDLGSAAACVGLGMMLRREPDKADKALELYRKGCTLGYAPGCFNAAQELQGGPQDKEALPLYEKACKATDPLAVSIREASCQFAAGAAHDAGEFERAADLAALGCSDAVQGACDMLGLLYQNGKGVAKDTAKAASLFHKGCETGHTQACEHEKAVSASRDSLAVEGANLEMASITVDGFTMSHMACKIRGGGLETLVAGPVLAGVVGKKKAALDACAPGGAVVSARWKIAGGHVVEAEAKAGDKKVEACVAKVVKSSLATFDATCRASFKLGRK